MTKELAPYQTPATNILVNSRLQNDSASNFRFWRLFYWVAVISLTYRFAFQLLLWYTWGIPYLESGQYAIFFNYLSVNWKPFAFLLTLCVLVIGVRGYAYKKRISIKLAWQTVSIFLFIWYSYIYYLTIPSWYWYFQNPSAYSLFSFALSFFNFVAITPVIWIGVYGLFLYSFKSNFLWNSTKIASDSSI